MDINKEKLVARLEEKRCQLEKEATAHFEAGEKSATSYCWGRENAYSFLLIEIKSGKFDNIASLTHKGES